MQNDGLIPNKELSMPNKIIAQINFRAKRENIPYLFPFTFYLFPLLSS